MGVILALISYILKNDKLLPRYGGYSNARQKRKDRQSCFPVMGVILQSMAAFSRQFYVASPLWGLFQIHPSACLGSSLPPKGTKSLLLPRYGGYSKSGYFSLRLRQLLPRYGGYSCQQDKYEKERTVASPLWGLFLAFAVAHLFRGQLLPRYGGYSHVCNSQS